MEIRAFLNGNITAAVEAVVVAVDTGQGGARCGLLVRAAVLVLGSGVAAAAAEAGGG